MLQPTMRIVTQDTCGGPEVLHLSEAPIPSPGPAEVLVHVVAAGLNPVDATTRAGNGVASVLGPPPFVLGWDVAGVVEAVGYGVHTLNPGDAVFGMPQFPKEAGCYAEYVVAPSRSFSLKPPGISYEEAAAVPLAAMTAWQVLTQVGRIGKGSRVLIHAAAGGVGHFAVQMAKRLGAVVFATTSERNTCWVEGLGADEVLDHRRENFLEAIGDIDLVIDGVADPETLTSQRSIPCLQPGGILVPLAHGETEELIYLAQKHRAKVKSFLVEPDRVALLEIEELLRKDKLKIHVDALISLEKIVDAHKLLEFGHTRGKLVMQVSH